MVYGWTGVNLEINLTRGKTEKKGWWDPNLAEAYLGGRGICTKILWDRVPPEVEPFSPDNLLIFGTGTLVGTIVPGANRVSVVTRSPQTNLATYSIFGGSWGPQLKQAGYDTIVISGKSPTPVFLWIDNDNIEIRDASHLWGKDIFETRKIIQEELKKDSVEIICIGPAGEKKVYAASIEEPETGVSASRTGAGAVMGDKNLKAIAVHGTKDINIAKMPELIELCERVLGRTAKIIDYWDKRAGRSLIGEGYLGNFDELTENPEKMRQQYEEIYTSSKIVSCSNCGMPCWKRAVPLPNGEYAYPKCQTFFEFIHASKIEDFNFSLKCVSLCERYGLDVMSTGYLVAFAIDLYEKGILTEQDTGGMRLEYGNEEVVFSLIKKIARREGIGDVLAKGVYEAARQIGRGAEKYAYHIKKLEHNPWPLYLPYFALMTAVDDRADNTKTESHFPQSMLLAYSKEQREAYIKEGYSHYPKEFDKYVLADMDWTGADCERQAQFVSYDGDNYALADATGICVWWMGWARNAPWTTRSMVADAISYVTGMDIDEVKATKIAQRIKTLTRAYNVMTGISRKDDRVGIEKFFRKSELPSRYSTYMPLDHGRFNKMIDEYYRIRGWNSSGIPSKEKLDELGLGYVREELERRGFDL